MSKKISYEEIFFHTFYVLFEREINRFKNKTQKIIKSDSEK